MQLKHHFEVTVQEVLRPTAQRGRDDRLSLSLVFDQRLHFVDEVSCYPQDLLGIVMLRHF